MGKTKKETSCYNSSAKSEKKEEEKLDPIFK